MHLSKMPLDFWEELDAVAVRAAVGKSVLAQGSLPLISVSE